MTFFSLDSLERFLHFPFWKDSDKFSFWHLPIKLCFVAVQFDILQSWMIQILMFSGFLTSSNIVIFWSYPILTFSGLKFSDIFCFFENSDIFRFWQVLIMTFSVSDIFWIWQKKYPDMFMFLSPAPFVFSGIHTAWAGWCGQHWSLVWWGSHSSHVDAHCGALCRQVRPYTCQPFDIIVYFVHCIFNLRYHSTLT